MSLTIIIIIIVAALAFILSNIMTLRSAKRFELPESYKARKAAEAAHLQNDNNDTSKKPKRRLKSGYENDYKQEDKDENW